MEETLSPSTMRSFTILKQIGKGSFGTVYKVKRKSDNKIYALKTINISKMDKKSIENTLTEIRILSSMENPYVCGYKEAFITKNNKDMCIVMEFVGGGDMSTKVEECKKRKLLINEQTIWKYFCQILVGLRALHELKIIHRDIKSANLFLSEDYETIKLGDLGVAKIAKDNLAQTQIGTPYYLAPEIWNNEVYNNKCDIFSLGCVIYEMCALKIPFDGNSLQDLYRKINRGIIKKIPKKYSSDLYHVIKLMLTKNPRKRPSAMQLMEYPIIKEKLLEFGYFDLKKEKENLDILMDTIIVPRNLNKLKKILPKQYRPKSCSRLSIQEPKSSLFKKSKKVSQNSSISSKHSKYSKKNLPPPSKKVAKNLPPVKRKPKVVQVKMSNLRDSQKSNKSKKVLRYQEYLRIVNQQSEKSNRPKKRFRPNSVDRSSKYSYKRGYGF